ncbi:hypothetical protein NDU88_006002 [Pleurodeles waltl]|uniref:CCHC-type domain-containing protein n=1 Tax=Pleurodeles waltl TaxID=8319 RepID=A0AAV7WCN5_PLEWA|nr:hypothetical protein NDU88_006002 [Pleurodeles waltl]
MKALEENYGKKVSIVVERHKFFSCAQKQGETIDQFVNSLRRIAISCKFRDLNDEIIRDQFINRVKEVKIQEKLLSLKNPTLDKTVEVAKHMESTSQYVKELNNTCATKEQNTVGEVRYSRKDTSKFGDNLAKRKECFRCGSDKHLAEAKNCPAINTRCFKCKKIGHFARVCRMVRENKFRKSVNAVRRDEQENSNSSEEELEVLAVEEGDTTVCIQLGSKTKEYNPPKCVIEINGKWIHMWADSCSPFTLIDEQIWGDLRHNELKPTDVLPEGYGGGKLPVLGYFDAELGFKDRKAQGRVYVVRQGRSLLGWKEQRALNIVLDPNHPKQVLLMKESKEGKWVATFPELFKKNWVASKDFNTR